MYGFKQFFTGGFLTGAVGIALIVGVIGCRREEPECIPSGKVNVVEVEKTPIPPGELSKAYTGKDQCHACVQSKRGFYSCQTVWQMHKETRDELKKLATEKACTDAGWEKGACPETAVKMVQCAGDEPPKDSKLAESFRRMMVRAATSQKNTSATPGADPQQEAASAEKAKGADEKKATGSESAQGSKKNIPEVE